MPEYCYLYTFNIFDMTEKSYRILIAVQSAFLLIAVGLGIWWYVHTYVTRNVEKTYEDGTVYKGEWLAGTMNGQGTLILPDGVRYEGAFKDGEMHGYGIQTIPDAEEYIGAFEYGNRNGMGKVVKADGSEYEGMWHAGHYHGQGRYLSPKGNVYQGEWAHGELKEGRLETENWTYTGEFKSLSPHGAGVTEYKDGRVYAGYWHRGYKQGLGRQISTNGRMEFGFWDQGTLIRSGKKEFKSGEKVYGIDVSRHQKSWKWEDLALYSNKKGDVFSSGIQSAYEVQFPYFVLMKATEGADMVDACYQANVAEAREGRLVKGAYHFMTTLSEIDEQIKNFIANAVVEPGDFPPVLDIETPHKRVAEVGEENIRAMALKWLKAVEEHYGVRPVIYTNNLFRKTYLDTPEFRKYDFWIARYGKRPDSGDWQVWQFTQTGTTRGVSARTDINIFDGNAEEFRSYLDKVWGIE